MHHREILGTLSLWSIGETRPRQSHQVTLPGNTNLGLLRLAQCPLALREEVQLFFSPSPTRLCVARFVGLTGLGMPLGRARVLPVVPRKARASPFASDVSHGQFASDVPRRYWLTHGPF